LQQDFGEVANFLTVYISEAHAQDEWPLGKKVCLNQHKTLEERISTAKSFQSDYKYDIPILVDQMDNNFDQKYASWPERFYILEDGKIALIGEPSLEFGYNRLDISDWLQHLLPQ